MVSIINVDLQKISRSPAEDFQVSVIDSKLQSQVLWDLLSFEISRTLAEFQVALLHPAPPGFFWTFRWPVIRATAAAVCCDRPRCSSLSGGFSVCVEIVGVLLGTVAVVWDSCCRGQTPTNQIGALQAGWSGGDADVCEATQAPV